MARNFSRQNVEWETPKNYTWDHVVVEVLMDIRDELRQIKRLAQCGRIPRALDAAVRIDKRLAKRVKL